MWVCCQSIVTKINFPCFIFCRKHWRYARRDGSSSKITHLLILDFEATCESKKKITQEIIEFPCLKVNRKTLFVESVFHHYVRPIINPELSVFCTELTGILQEMVDSSKTFPDVFKDFEDWRRLNDLTVENSVYITSGDWDLGRMLPQQCQLSGLTLPEHTKTWIDLKKLYSRVSGTLPKSLIEIIRKCGLTFQGRQHSGIDDCVNILNVVRKLNSPSYSPTSSLKISGSDFSVVDTNR